MALLEVEKIGRRFAGLVALNNVTFQVQPRRIQSVIGPNGAGKTTLFNVISGLIRSESGRIALDGKEISGLRPFQIAEAGIARTFQTPGLFLEMSAIENVMVGRHCRTHSGFAACCLRWPGQYREERDIRKSSLEWLNYVGLAHLAHMPTGSLAFGQRRMVELARALAIAPKLLMLDEPASGLNTKETAELAALISRIREDGVTVLLVEHDMSLVMEISDHILVLHNGTPIAEGTPEEIQNNEDVMTVYLGKGFENAAASQKSSMRVR